MNFEFYVLNHNFNAKKIENFNIFDNILLAEETEKEVRKYLRGPSKYKYVKIPINGDKEVIYGFDGFCEKLKSLIRWQEWARCEYEISVGSLFEEDVKKKKKWDCYKQALPNIPIIAREVIYQYKQQIKKK